MAEQEENEPIDFVSRAIIAAKDPKTPARILSGLSRSSNIHILTELARNTSTPGFVLDRLSQNKNPDVFCLVAGNSSTPAETLWEMNAKFSRLLTSENPSEADAAVYEYCRQKIATNQATPKDLLCELAKDTNLQILCGVAGNPSTPQETLRELHDKMQSELAPNRASVYCLEMIASNPSTPLDILRRLSQEADVRISDRAEKNLGTPANKLYELLQSRNIRVIRELADNPRVPGAILDELSRHRDLLVFLAVAGNPSTPLETRWGMRAKVDSALSLSPSHISEEERLIYAVARDILAARNTKTPAKKLYELSRSSNILVLRALANNSRAPGDVLDVLSRHRDPYIFLAITGNPSTPRETMWEMHAKLTTALSLNTGHLSEGERLIYMACLDKIAGNPSTPQNLLRVLVQDGGPRLFGAIEDATSAEGRLGSRSISCLEAVASNPSAPKDLLLMIHRLGIREVRSKVEKNLARRSMSSLVNGVAPGEPGPQEGGVDGAQMRPR